MNEKHCFTFVLFYIRMHPNVDEDSTLSAKPQRGADGVSAPADERRKPPRSDPNTVRDAASVHNETQGYLA